MANSYNDYTVPSNISTTTVFATPPYLEGRAATDISVIVAGTTLATSQYAVSGTSILFNQGYLPTVGQSVRVSRQTSRNVRLTDFSDASLLTADALDNDSNQLFYMAQEAVDASERTDFGAQTFYSSGTTDPTSANDGDLFFNSQTGLLKIYNNNAWVPINNRGDKQTFNVSTSTTQFTPSNPVDDNTLVFLNGVLLVKGIGSAGDYTTSATVITLNTAVSSGVVETVSFPNATSSFDTLTAVDGNFSGDLTCNDLTTASLSLTYNSSSIGFSTPKTILRETGNGDFRIEGQDLHLNVSDDSSPSFANGVVYKRIDCEAGSTGSVGLWHGANAKKLETTATGIDVTGTITPSGGYKSSDGTAGYTGSASASATLTIKNGLIVAVS